MCDSPNTEGVTERTVIYLPLKDEPVEDESQSYHVGDNGDVENQVPDEPQDVADDSRENLLLEDYSQTNHLPVGRSEHHQEPDDRVEMLEVVPEISALQESLSGDLEKGGDRSWNGLGRRKRHPCPDCSYSTDRAGHLKLHVMARHTSSKPFACSACDYSAVHASHLKRHVMAKHKHEKPHVCSYCEYSTVQAGHLKIHVMTKHKNEKPHACPFCDYSTAHSGNLKVHITGRHTNDKPHYCEKCEYSTFRIGDLRRHFMTKHTNIKPHSCSECSYSAVQARDLKKHYYARHYLG